MQEVIYTVSGVDYAQCLSAANNFWSSKKGGIYGAGLVNSKFDKRKVERTGLLGEMAFARIFGLEPDLEYREYGRRYDFVFLGNKLDVKTAIKNYGSGLILAVSESGATIPLHCEIYVFSHIDFDDTCHGVCRIVFHGFQTKDFIQKIIPQKSSVRGALHKNYVVQHSLLIPITELKK
jgi:hypothetical protein